jgi:hypothetical protein
MAWSQQHLCDIVQMLTCYQTEGNFNCSKLVITSRGWGGGFKATIVHTKMMCCFDLKCMINMTFSQV